MPTIAEIDQHLVLLRMQRTPARQELNQSITVLEEELIKAEPCKMLVDGMWKNIERKGANISNLDAQIMATICDKVLCPEVTNTAEEVADEHAGAEAFQDRLGLLRAAVETLLAKDESVYESGRSSATTNRASVDRRLKLPKIEWKKFSGDPKDWLGFWGQFEKIDSDTEMNAADKFQYLLQAVEKKSRAGELVASFPPSASCYPKAIESLRSRFGREDILVEVYVRDLLQLVLQRAAHQKKIVLSSLYDRLETSLRALETLGLTSDKFAAMLYPLVESCLPEEILRTWERRRCHSTPHIQVPVSVAAATSAADAAVATPDAGAVADLSPPSSQPNQLNLLMAYLRSEVEGEERIAMARKGFAIDKEEKQKKVQSKGEEISHDTPTAAGLFTGESKSNNPKKKSSCVFCGKSHDGKDCYQASKMSIGEKTKILTEKNACSCCLSPNHSGKCRPFVRCTLCSKKHYVNMCPDLEVKKTATITSGEKEPAASSSNTLANQTCTEDVCLQTLLVRIYNGKEEKIVRALIDSGSQRSYLDSYAAEKMGYSSIGEEKIKNSLFGGLTTKEKTHQKYRVWLSNMDRSYRCNFVTLEEEKICGSIARVRNGPWTKQLKEMGIQLSDVGADLPEIRLLIGGDVAGKLFTGKKHDLSSGPVAFETFLGWTLLGKTGISPQPSAAATVVTTAHVADAALQSLWQLDVIGITDPAEKKSREELQQAAMQYFKETVTREPDGRYQVSLPWISDHGHLKSNRQIAEKRLQNSTKKLVAEKMMSAYNQIFEEWLSDNVIEKVPAEEISSFGHFLPHRAVVKPSSQTTPVRPVFDASAHEKFSPSLNDCLEKGPNLLELIPDVLTRFRLERFGLVSDIKRAFLQMSIRKEDRDFLRFLWWEDPQENCSRILEFRHKRVLFGVSASPFLLGATINHHIDTAPPQLQKTGQHLKSSFYVDNSVASFATEEKMQIFREESTALMASAKFDLRGWTSNSKEAEEDETLPVLGLSWNLKQDTLACLLIECEMKPGEPVTKRGILSAAHKIFDPIGFTCPVTLLPKLLLQRIWEMKAGWDEELSEDISTEYKKWAASLTRLSTAKIPRWLFGTDCPRDTWQLHVFVDASKAAYSACIFIRGISVEGISVQLISAKTRVAPVKTVSIPRLELMACCIGSRLADSIKKAISYLDMRTIFWTDSSNALSWIQKSEQWATYVANRVKEIRELSNYEAWRHVPGHLNPADLPSRGCTADQLLGSKWWEGPDWLRETEELWPNFSYCPDEDIVNSERRKTVAAHTTTTDSEKFSETLTHYMSEYRSIIRVVAYIRRFGRKRNDAVDKPTGILTVKELEDAETSLVWLIQQESLAENKDIFNCVRLSEDKKGVQTKILRREDLHDFRSPAVLPSQHPLVKLLIRAKHLEMSHAGVQFVQSALRERFWILRSRKTIKEVVRACVRCRRFTAKPLVAEPTALPPDRVRDASVFEITGVDLTGPLYLKGGKKVWIVLYTCAVYRAVHLELTGSLSTEAFLQTLRRFVARRGRPTTVYSDNGTNFVGANNLFTSVNWDVVAEKAAIQKIQWRFIAATGAWHGGWWERLIQMVKKILRPVLGNVSLNYEELLTILCDVEAILNGRPLTYLSEDPEDLTPLTPAMFLQEVRGSGVADMDLLDSQGLNRRLVYCQKLREDLRSRFRREYLGMLIQPKSQRKVDIVSPGNIVLIGDDIRKRIDWILGKVIAVYPGKDDKVRVVRLKTAKGELVRPIQRLFPLEVSSEERPTIQPPQQEIHPESHDQNPTSNPKQNAVTRSGRHVKLPDRLNYHHH